MFVVRDVDGVVDLFERVDVAVSNLYRSVERELVHWRSGTVNEQGASGVHIYSETVSPHILFKTS